MQKVQSDWAAVAAELTRRLTEFSDGPKALARLSGINYHAARRFLQGGVHNRNKNTKKLCHFFKLDAAKTAKPQSRHLDDLTGLIQKVWDGTAPHAELLAGLIESTK